MTNINIEKPNSSIEGVNSKVAQGIYSMLKDKGRRRFGVSGSYMMHQSGSEEYKIKGVKRTIAKEFLQAENDLSKFLLGWVKDKPNAVLIESARVPGAENSEPSEVDEEKGIIDGIDTDHIVIIGDEVILIDTTAWPKKKTYTIGDEGEVLMTKKTFAFSDVPMKKNIYQWYHYLDESASLIGIVCINSPETTVIRNKNWYLQDFRVVEFGRFEELLNKKYDEIDDDDRNKINSTLVAQCVVRCIKPYDERTKVINSRGLSELR